MAFPYVAKKVVDCSVSPDLASLKDKCVIVTGGKHKSVLGLVLPLKAISL